MRGLSILFASGDFGTGCNQSTLPAKFAPEWPPTSPYVTAVGGTMLTEAKSDSPSSTESAWNQAGGGFAFAHARPSYQVEAVEGYLRIARADGSLPDASLFNASNRGFPDVSAIATNYVIVINGEESVATGTSASTPTWAAMITLLNDARHAKGMPPLGFLNPFLYQHADAMNDVTDGANDAFSCFTGNGFAATKGWDPASGLGTPMFESLVAAATAQSTPSTSRPPAAPVLNIDLNEISCGGISSGADFSVQFATAFSAHVMGVAVFAGQPFHCAATRFSLDAVFPCNETKPGAHTPVGPAGCQTTPFPLPTVPRSPPGVGLLWDHCKGCTPASLAQLLKHPDLVDVATLAAYARTQAEAGLVDDVSHLARTRSFVFRGTKDPCYTHGVMQQTTEFFSSFANDSKHQVRFVDNVPSLHCIPTLSTGTPCGTELHGPKAYAPNAMHGLGTCNT